MVGDLGDAAFVGRVLRASAPDVIFHLASSRERSVAAEAFRKAITTDVRLAINVFSEACALPHLKSLVTLGTAEEYGNGALPFTEQQRECPVSAYSLSKLCATHLAQIMHRAYGLPAVVLRPGIIYGPGQPADMLIAQLFEAARLGESVPMTPGEQTRDFLFIEDAVEALVQAAVSPPARGEVINIGSGAEVRLNDLVKMVEGVTGRSGIARMGLRSYRANEIMAYMLDHGKARRLLGWTAHTSLEDGLTRTWREIS